MQVSPIKKFFTGDFMYRTQFYHGRARECQVQANLDNCTAYVQACFNQSENPKDNYTSVAIASNAMDITRRWAKKYAQLVSDDFDTPLGGKEGIMIGGAYGEHELDLIYTNMPAILVKPLFSTNPLHAEWIKSKAGQLRLARILVNSILSLFPNGGLIGFCLCAANEYGNNTDTYADMVLRQAAIMLQSNKTYSAAPLHKAAGV